jgi:hypothetical protein
MSSLIKETVLIPLQNIKSQPWKIYCRAIFSLNVLRGSCIYLDLLLVNFHYTRA